MTRFNIALFTLLLPAVLAAPPKRSPLFPCKRNITDGYGPIGTGTGIPLSTGVPISILSSSLADASPDPSAAPVDSGSDDCPATTTITSTNIITETVSHVTNPAQTQASGSSAVESAGFTAPAGPYGNSTGGSSQYYPGPTGTAGSTGRSSRHGHKHQHKTTKSPKSTGTSVVEGPASIGTAASSSSSDFSSTEAITSEAATSEASDVASAVQVTSTTASSTVIPAASSDLPLTPTTTTSTIAVPASTIASSPTSEYSSSSASSTSAAGGEFYQAPKSKAAPSSTDTSSSTTSSPSSSPSSSTPSPPSSPVQSSTDSTTSTGVSATVAATPNSAYSSNTGTGKRGLAYNAASLTTCFDQSSQVSWAYNWGSSTSGLSSAFEYVPMLWSTQSQHTSNWQTAASAAIASGSKHLLSFNEPDLSSQSNLSPAAAAAGHKTYLQPFAGRAKLSAPAVTNAGLTWLEQFLVACSSCTIDFVPVHWYDSASNVGYFKSYVTSAIAAAKGRPVWITEFGASGSQAQQVAFLQEVMPWLDGQAGVERYAYFGVFDGNLVSGTSLSALGQTFATYT